MSEVETGVSMFGMLANASIVVKLVLLMLVGMSLTSWAIIVHKALLYKRIVRLLAEDYETFVEADNLSAAVQSIGRDSRSPVKFVAWQGLAELKRIERSDQQFAARGKLPVEHSLANIGSALALAIKVQLRDLGSMLNFLATTATITPFVGLFGTVWGILSSFQAIGQMKAASLATVAPGISEALVATAIGLAVAIPASMAYNTFTGMLHSMEVDLGNFGEVFLNRLRREMPSVRDDGRSAGQKG